MIQYVSMQTHDDTLSILFFTLAYARFSSWDFKWVEIGAESIGKNDGIVKFRLPKSHSDFLPVARLSHAEHTENSAYSLWNVLFFFIKFIPMQQNPPWTHIVWNTDTGAAQDFRRIVVIVTVFMAWIAKQKLRARWQLIFI